jgi:hypothetical protein
VAGGGSAGSAGGSGADMAARRWALSYGASSKVNGGGSITFKTFDSNCSAIRNCGRKGAMPRTPHARHRDRGSAGRRRDATDPRPEHDARAAATHRRHRPSKRCSVRCEQVSGCPLPAALKVLRFRPHQRTMSRHVLRSAFAAVLAVAAGCSAPAVDSEPLASTQEALFANDKTAYDYFIGKGLTNFQAAGVVGNLDQESGIDPAIHQAGGGVGRGIAQWSAGARWDTTNNDNVVAYAAQHGQSATSLGLQLDFIWYELTTFPAYGLTQLKASTNLTDATTVFEDMFEGCVYANYPECALPSRVNFAKGIFNAYGANTGQGGQGGGGAGGAAGASAGGGGAGGAAAGASGAGGTSISGTAGSDSIPVAGSASGGVTSGAGGTPFSGAAGAATAGNVSVAGASATAGSTSVAGATAAAGTTGSAGSPSFGAPSTNDSSCALSQPANPRSNRDLVLYSLGALMAATWLFRRRH